MMKQGVRRLLVAKSVVWKGMSKRFSILYNGKWLKNLEASGSSSSLPSNRPSTSSYPDKKFCCLSREDMLRFIIGCLGALAPLPLSSISALGAINPHYYHIDTSSPALEAAQKRLQDPSAVAVVECTSEGHHKIIGDISASRLWKCDYVAAAWALANLTAGQFVMGVEEDNVSSRALPDFSFNSQIGDNGGGGTPVRPRKFSSRSIGFFSNPSSPSALAVGTGRSMYRGRSTPLTCKVTSSLAAVLAQMLSHRATHVWVTEAESEDVLVGVIGYTDILGAVTKHPTTVVSVTEVP
ncbi:CBS domain-containing protein CBSX6-like [Macadamia integrifolia]|uniref:CBS domain-containing protein CBSX6-like n=1 Tax=Macadamia integrifolia TaxID=60698 RepID=UPI001C52D34F|nr:CBS domain-containing protein CBSX6-like [Macadamia integrifolia]